MESGKLTLPCGTIVVSEPVAFKISASGVVLEGCGDGRTDNGEPGTTIQASSTFPTTEPLLIVDGARSTTVRNLTLDATTTDRAKFVMQVRDTGAGFTQSNRYENVTFDPRTGSDIAVLVGNIEPKHTVGNCATGTQRDCFATATCTAAGEGTCSVELGDSVDNEQLDDQLFLSPVFGSGAKINIATNSNNAEWITVQNGKLDKYSENAIRCFRGAVDTYSVIMGASSSVTAAAQAVRIENDCGEMHLERVGMEMNHSSNGTCFETPFGVCQTDSDCVASGADYCSGVPAVEGVVSAGNCTTGLQRSCLSDAECTAASEGTCSFTRSNFSTRLSGSISIQSHGGAAYRLLHAGTLSIGGLMAGAIGGNTLVQTLIDNRVAGKKLSLGEIGTRNFSTNGTVELAATGSAATVTQNIPFSEAATIADPSTYVDNHVQWKPPGWVRETTDLAIECSTATGDVDVTVYRRTAAAPNSGTTTVVSACDCNATATTSCTIATSGVGNVDSRYSVVLTNNNASAGLRIQFSGTY